MPCFSSPAYEHYLDRRFNSARLRRENAAGAARINFVTGFLLAIWESDPGWLLELWYVLSARFALRIISLAARQRNLSLRDCNGRGDARETETKLKNSANSTEMLATT